MTTTRRADSLTALALAGTGHSPNAPIVTGAPVDGLPLPGEDAGRDLLLRAGALATYRTAGLLPTRDVTPLEPARDESLPPCPPEATTHLEGLLMTRNHALLPEAFARVERSGRLLPPSLLPLALETLQREARAALLPLLGERGRWLARFNSDWAWAAETLPGDGDALPPDAETIWQEGATTQRVALLAQLRVSDPARARAWLEGVWKREKAETRAAMLETLATGLSPDDEPLLDAALNNDRGERVRAVAARLLAMLPNSALTLRIRERAGAALVYDGAALDANPPTATDSGWARDGLPTQSIVQKAGQRAFWLAQLLERVPPSHWEERFGGNPGDLIAATAQSKWRTTILSGWTAATVRFQANNWAVPLWEAWLTVPPKVLKQAAEDRASLCAPLAPLLPPATLEAFALRVIADPTVYDGILLYEALDLLPRPWSLAIARAYLAGLRAFTERIDPQSRTADPWDNTLSDAALACRKRRSPRR